MMKISTFYFHMPEIVAIGTIVGIRYAATIMQKGILEIGKHVGNVEKILRPKCMFTMEQMSITSKSSKILPSMNPLLAPSVAL